MKIGTLTIKEVGFKRTATEYQKQRHLNLYGKPDRIQKMDVFKIDNKGKDYSFTNFEKGTIHNCGCFKSIDNMIAHVKKWYGRPVKLEITFTEI